MKIQNITLLISLLCSSMTSFASNNNLMELGNSSEEISSFETDRSSTLSTIKKALGTQEAFDESWREPLVKVQQVMYPCEGISNEDLFPHRARTRGEFQRLEKQLWLQDQPAIIPLIAHKIAIGDPQHEGEALQQLLQKNPEFSGCLWLKSGTQKPVLNIFPKVYLAYLDENFEAKLFLKKSAERLLESYEKKESRILAYEILNQCGGVFVFEAEGVLNPIAPLNRFFCFYMPFEIFSTKQSPSIIASSSNNQAIKKLIEDNSKEHKDDNPFHFLVSKNTLHNNFSRLGDEPYHGIITLSARHEPDKFCSRMITGFKFF